MLGNKHFLLFLFFKHFYTLFCKAFQRKQKAHIEKLCRSFFQSLENKIQTFSREDTERQIRDMYGLVPESCSCDWLLTGVLHGDWSGIVTRGGGVGCTQAFRGECSVENSGGWSLFASSRHLQGRGVRHRLGLNSSRDRWRLD